MISLFIDTSSKNIIVAVIKNKDILSLIMEANDNTLSERIFPLLIKAMNEANKDIKAIEKVYVVNGPGSFTGVRVGSNNCQNNCLEFKYSTYSYF